MADAITVAPRRSEAVARIIPAAHVASCVSSLTNGPSLTITGAVTGFEGFEGAGHSIAVMPAPRPSAAVRPWVFVESSG